MSQPILFSCSLISKEESCGAVIMVDEGLLAHLVLISIVITCYNYKAVLLPNIKQEGPL